MLAEWEKGAMKSLLGLVIGIPSELTATPSGNLSPRMSASRILRSAILEVATSDTMGCPAAGILKLIGFVPKIGLEPPMEQL